MTPSLTHDSTMLFFTGGRMIRTIDFVVRMYVWKFTRSNLFKLILYDIRFIFPLLSHF